MPPTPVLREDNWPLLMVTKSVFDRLEAGAAAAEADEEGEQGGGTTTWTWVRPGGAEEARGDGEAGEEGRRGRKGRMGKAGGGWTRVWRTWTCLPTWEGQTQGFPRTEASSWRRPPAYPSPKSGLRRPFSQGSRSLRGRLTLPCASCRASWGSDFAPSRQGFIDLSLGSHAPSPASPPSLSCSSRWRQAGLKPPPGAVGCTPPWCTAWAPWRRSSSRRTS